MYSIDQYHKGFNITIVTIVTILAIGLKWFKLNLKKMNAHYLHILYSLFKNNVKVIHLFRTHGQDIFRIKKSCSILLNYSLTFPF